MNRSIFFTISLFLFSFVQNCYGQFSIQGKVLEASSQQPLDYATIVVFDTSTQDMLGGVTSENGGNFSIEVDKENVYIEISFIGLEPKTITEIQFTGGKVNLGSIFLGAGSEVLDEIVVRADKSTTEFKLDKRVFNVGSDLSTTGMGALEVLNNVPSVNVSIEGDVSLRGSTGVQILINGKPSVLADGSSNALGSITADMIEKVEVITNPSAKYEAEGTAGIINIVLKKNEKKGINGSISLNTGIPQNHSLGFSMNNRTEKFNLFTQLGIGYRELPTFRENIIRDNLANSELISDGTEYRNEVFYNVILGTDYYINPLNVITLSGSFSYEVEDQPSTTDFNLYTNDLLERTWSRTEATSATNPKLQYELQYKKDFEDFKEHKLLFSAIGRYFGKAQSSVFTNSATLGSLDFRGEETATEFDEGKFTFNLDYTKPFNKQWTLETGAQYLDNDVSNDFEVRDEDEDGNFISDPNLTNVFEYKQDVLGVYSTGAYEGDVWGLKLGLRVENTNLETLLVNTGEGNKNNFTDLFPSAHSSYKFSDRVSFQAGYSRRIFRPRLWDLNPFFNIRNNFNIRQGNPNLLPEYTDSYEAGSIFIFEAISFNLNLFHRFTTGKIERVITFLDGVSFTTPQNIGTNKATGLEANFKWSPSKKMVISGDGLYNIFVREGVFIDQNFDFSADQWSGKLTTKYKFNKSLDAEVTLRHQSREQTIQGLRVANTFADFGLRYKIMKGKGVFNFSIRDIFASRFNQLEISQADFYSFDKSRRGRFITFGFSYGFGKGEAMQYSGNRRR